MLGRLRARLAKTLGGSYPVPSHWPMNWWQTARDHRSPSYSANSVVEACVAAYAQTIAQLPFNHVQIQPDGERLVLTDTNVASMLWKPNSEQTASFFMHNLVYSLYYTGNAYWVGDSNVPSGFTQMYLLDPRPTTPRRVQETGDIYYDTSGEWARVFDTSGSAVLIPERAVGHVRLYAPRDPLIGVTPIEFSAPSISAHNAITNHQGAFYNNMARPSGVLSTDMKLTADQMKQLREAWNDQAKDLNSGGVPILSNGLSWEPLTMSSQDAEMVRAWQMTVEEISRVYRVPPMLINSMDKSTFNNAETLMSFWLSSGLGFAINHIEQEMASFFDLPANEEIVADTRVLLRTDYETRINGLNTAVAGGLIAINEGREELGYGPVTGGEVPRIQAQYIPIDQATVVQQPVAEPEPDPVTTDNVELAFDPRDQLIMLTEHYMKEKSDAA